MLAFSFVLNFIACCVFALTVIRNRLAKRETPYVELFEAFLTGTLLYCVETFVIIEVLSAANLLSTPYPFAACYTLVFLGLATGIYRRRETIREVFRDLRKGPTDRLVLAAVIIIGVFEIDNPLG